MNRASLVALAALAACGNAQDVVVGEDYRRVHDPLRVPTDKLDVLFVVDTSASMAPELAALEAAGEELFGQLATDLGGPPDLHIAFVSTDVGSGRTDVPGCPAESWDGRFRLGDAAAAGCGVSGTFLVDEDDGNGGRTTNYGGTLIDTFSCAISMGVSGCGFEQPLEAMRRALDGRHPENDGFLRDDALLLVVVITDEDDCSVFDNELFGDPGAGLTSPLGPRTNFRCFEFGVVCDPDEPRSFGAKTDCVPREDSAYITPVGHFVDALRGLKPDPAMVMVAGMYGTTAPVVVVEDRWNPGSGIPSLQSTCTAPGTEIEVTPPIRLATLADELPSRFVFTSLCDAAMSQRVYRVTRSTTGVMQQRPCLLGDLAPETTSERCRAFDVIGTTMRPIDRCDRSTASNCFDITASPQCDYTPSGLAASYRGTLPAGHRLVVECLARVP